MRFGASFEAPGALYFGEISGMLAMKSIFTMNCSCLILRAAAVTNHNEHVARMGGDGSPHGYCHKDMN